MPPPDPSELPAPLYTKAQVDALLSISPTTNGLTFSIQNGVLVITDAQAAQWRTQQLVPNS